MISMSSVGSSHMRPKRYERDFAASLVLADASPVGRQNACTHDMKPTRDARSVGDACKRTGTTQQGRSVQSRHFHHHHYRSSPQSAHGPPTHLDSRLAPHCRVRVEAADEASELLRLCARIYFSERLVLRHVVIHVTIDNDSCRDTRIRMVWCAPSTRPCQNVAGVVSFPQIPARTHVFVHTERQLGARASPPRMVSALGTRHNSGSAHTPGTLPHYILILWLHRKAAVLGEEALHL